MFAAFPKECCTYTSDMLATYLMENGIKRERIVEVRGETSHSIPYTHCWLQIDEAYVVDITADQFNKIQFFAQYTPIPTCCIERTNTYIYECFNVSPDYNFGIESLYGDNRELLQKFYEQILLVLQTL